MIDLPNFENTRKFYHAFRGLPLRWKLLWGSVLICIVGFLIYLRLGPWHSLNAELSKRQEQNDLAQQTITNLEGEIDKLRAEKAEVHRENLYHKSIAESFRPAAEKLYPHLEASAALAKLAEDVAAVRELATRDVYRPLEPQIRADMITNLKALRNKNPSFAGSIQLYAEAGNKNRQMLAKDVADILSEAGFDTMVESPAVSFFADTPPDVIIALHPDDEEFARTFGNIIAYAYVRTVFAPSSEGAARGSLRMAIYGEPLFLPNGVVTFR